MYSLRRKHLQEEEKAARDEWADPAAGELALAARRAREEVKRRALLSAGAVLVPLPGLDVAVDVGVLVSMMNAVNRAFCLSPDQIERLGMEERVAVYEALFQKGVIAVDGGQIQDVRPRKRL